MKFKKLNEEFGTVLKIDIDQPFFSWFTIKSLEVLSVELTIKKIIIKKSPSGKGLHMVICLDEILSDALIIAWQFALGSDRARERYNLVRLMNGNSMEQWNILFSNKISIPIWFDDDVSKM